MPTTEHTDEMVSQKVALSEYVQDIEVLQDDFNDLAKLTAKVARMQTCLINLVGTDLQGPSAVTVRLSPN